MERRNFGPNHYEALSEHLDKRHEVLVEAHRLTVHALQKLQVEEQMLLRKLYDVMLAEGLTKKNDINTNASCNGGAEQSNKEVNDAK